VWVDDVILLAIVQSILFVDGKLPLIYALGSFALDFNFLAVVNQKIGI